MSWVCGGPPGFHPGALVYMKVVQGASGSPVGVAREPDITPVRHPEPLVLFLFLVSVLIRTAPAPRPYTTICYAMFYGARQLIGQDCFEIILFCDTHMPQVSTHLSITAAASRSLAAAQTLCTAPGAASILFATAPPTILSTSNQFV